MNGFYTIWIIAVIILGILTLICTLDRKTPEIHEREEPKTKCPTSRSYKILEVSKKPNVSERTKKYYDDLVECRVACDKKTFAQFRNTQLGEPWTGSEEYLRGLVVDKIMEMLK